MSYNFRTPCLLVIMPKCGNLSFWSSELLIVKEWIWTSFLSFSGWKLIQIQALFNQYKITTELFIETPLEWFLLCCVSPIFLAVRKRVQNRIPALSGHWLGWKESLSQRCRVWGPIQVTGATALFLRDERDESFGCGAQTAEGQRRERGRQRGRQRRKERHIGREGGRKGRREGSMQGERKGGKKSPDLVKETCMAQLSEAAFLLQVYLCPFHTNSLGKLSCCTFIKFGNSLV